MPGGIPPAEDEGSPVFRDPSHMVQGLDNAPPLLPPEPEVAPGPKVGERIEVEEEEQTAAAADMPVPQLCPSCGWDTSSKEGPAMPDEEDKREWVAHVLGAPRFRKTYDLMGGQVKVTFRNRTQEEDDAVFAQLAEDIKTGSLPDRQPVFLNVEYGHRMHVYFMAYSVEQIRSSSGKVAVDFTDPLSNVGSNATTAMLDRLKKGVSQGLYQNLIEMQRRFESVIRTLVARGSDPNFWEPTAG